MQSCAILIPTYNSGATIAATLESIQRQSPSTLRSITCVLINDDCSSDRTEEIALSVWTIETPLEIRKRPANGGERRNVNDGITYLSALVEWVLVIHSDDLAKESWLDLMLRQISISDSRTATICSSWDNLMPTGKVIPGEDDMHRNVELIPGTKDAIRSTMRKGCWWHISGCGIRTKAFTEIGGFAVDMPQLGDFEWLVRCMRKGWSIEYIPRTLICYRIHNSSVSFISFQSDQDIVERLRIHRSNSDLLHWIDSLRLFCLVESFWVRRFGRALLKSSPKRVLRLLRLQCAILWDSLMCALRK